MPTKGLNQRTLFITGPKKLEESLQRFYEESHDANAVVEYLVALLVKNALCVGDAFSFFCKELIRDILLLTEPTEVLRLFAPLFHSYFSGGEWKRVTARLYKNNKEYHQYDDQLYEYKQQLFSKTTPIEELAGEQYKVLSFFKDGNGKLHTWSLRGADPYSSNQKLYTVLKLMTLLTIFRKDGVRRFAELVNAEKDNCTRQIAVRKGEIMEETAPLRVGKPGQAPLLSEDIDIDMLSDEVKLELVKLLLPKGFSLIEPPSQMSEKKKLPDTASASEKSIATTQQIPTDTGSVTATNLEASAPAVKEPSAKKSKTRSKPQSLGTNYYAKSKSKKQKDKDYKDSLLKEAGLKPKNRKRNKRK